MRLNKLKLSTVLLYVLVVHGLQAQEVINATGGNASGSGGLVSYSVGQVVYSTNTSTSGMVEQGVQQPYEISVITEMVNAKGIELMVTAYPNPVTDYFTLKIDGNMQKQYFAYLCDIQGKELRKIRLSGNQTSLAMTNLVPATYFLKVTEGNNQIKTFKIIKK